MVDEMIPLDINLTYILGAILLSVPGYLTWWSSRIAAKEAAQKAEVVAQVATQKVEAVRNDLQKTSATIAHEVGTIHAAVNSERADMVRKIEELHATILELTKTAAAPGTITTTVIKKEA